MKVGLSVSAMRGTPLARGRSLQQAASMQNPAEMQKSKEREACEFGNEDLCLHGSS
jgi:hypothetical protein